MNVDSFIARFKKIKNTIRAKLSPTYRNVCRIQNKVESIYSTTQEHATSLKEVQAEQKELVAALKENRQSIEQIVNILRNETAPIRSIISLRQKKATQEAMEFIETNAPLAPMFENELEHLSFIMNRIIEEDDTEGLFLEFGVYSGKTINHCSAIIRDVTFYGFDSFTGLPEEWTGNPHFYHAKGTFSRSGEQPKVNENVRLVKGWFEDTLPRFVSEHSNETIRFLHIDCDIYSSTKTVLNNLHRLITSGTIIVFDEFFNYPGWRHHEYKAFMEFVEKYRVKYEFISFGRMPSAIKIIAHD